MKFPRYILELTEQVRRSVDPKATNADVQRRVQALRQDRRVRTDNVDAFILGWLDLRGLV